MEETSSESELEQLKKFETFRRLVTSISLRILWVPVVVFLVAFVALFALVSRRARYAERFEAHAVLFFRPHDAEHAKAATDVEVIQILMRRAVREKLADALAGGVSGEGFRSTIVRTTDFIPDERNTSIYHLFARASQADIAVKRANTFAQVCLDEYAKYRADDLDVLLKSSEENREEILRRLKDLDKEEDELNKTLGLLQPRQELKRLNDELLRQKTALSEANVRLAREKAQEDKFQHELGIFPKTIVDGIEMLKTLLTDADKAGTEMSDAEIRYTEKNPKLIVARERYASLKSRVAAFCKEHGIKAVDLATVKKIEELMKSQAEAQAKTSLAQETTEALQVEINKNEDQVHRLQEVVPSFDRLASRRETFQKSLAEVENVLSDIRYQKVAIKRDLVLVEPVRVPDETPLITAKKMILVLLFSGGAAGGAGVVLLLFCLLFGRVHDIREVSIYSELIALGSMPPDGKKFVSVQDENRVMEGVYYRFRGAVGDIRSMLVGRLPKAEFSPALQRAFDWNCAMFGKRLLRVEIVPSREFEMTDDMEALGGIVLGRNGAFFPVNDISRLSPSELALLESDVKTLSERYDLFVFGRSQPFSEDSIFFEQMMKFCDCALLFVGARKTPRRALRAAVLHQKAAEKPMCVVVTDENDWKLVRGGVK